MRHSYWIGLTSDRGCMCSTWAVAGESCYCRRCGQLATAQPASGSITTYRCWRGRKRWPPRALDGRVDFVYAESAAWDQPADRVLCVGASHAWEGVSQALGALTELLRPGGRVLFGEGCWERPPTAAAAAMFGHDVIPLAEMACLARAAGWQVLHLSTADQREWDDFEATWRGGRQQWLLEHPDDDAAADVQDTLDRQLKDYLEVYRGILGFGYLVLGR